MIGKVNAGLEEGLKERNKRASKILQNKKGNVIATCCLEVVRFFTNTRNFLFIN
jgi:broad-specificity NMP kinase